MTVIEGILNRLLSIVSGKSVDENKQSKPNGNNQDAIFSGKESQDKRDKTLVGGYSDLMQAMDEVSNEIEYVTHTVKRGDTFSSLSLKYDVSLDELKKANPKVHPSLIRIGQEIAIPVKKTTKPAASKAPAQKTSTPTAQKPVETPAKTKPAEPQKKVYAIKTGDTLWQIAQDHKITVSALQKANGGTISLAAGKKIVIPAPHFNADMKVDAAKETQYRNAIVKMMREKGVTNQETINELSNLITKKAIAMNVDPVLISGIIGQEVGYKYKSDNIWGVNGKGIMQLTEVTVADLYRCKPGVADCYLSCKDEITALMKKYPTAKSLYNAICKKENYALNLEVGIIIFKGKLELDYTKNPQKSEKQHIQSAVRNYNGNTKKRASGIEIRDEYRNKIIANYDKHKIS